MTTLTVHPRVLREAAVRCLQTAEEVRAAASSLTGQAPDLGHPRTDERVRRCLEDLRASVSGLAEAIEQDAAGVHAAAESYELTDRRVLGPAVPTAAAS